ncbi:MAG: GAF domain-containing protein, partial [Rudaea sp.]
MALGLAGLVALGALTDLRAIPPLALPLASFILLSFIVKRAGVHVGPDTLHSLVGIVDLAAIFIFSPIPGAWVPALSSLLYVVVAWVQEDKHEVRDLIESGIGNSGARGLLGLLSGWVYIALGGPVPPTDLASDNGLAAAGAILTWFLLDNLTWALVEILRMGGRRFYRLFRETLGYSILVELIPLPFSMVIAVVYTVFGGIGGAIFLLMAAALVEIAFVLQRYADVQERIEHRTDELAALNEFSQAVSRAGFDTDRVIELLMEYAQRVSIADCYRLELLSAEHDRVQVCVESRGGRLEWKREEQPLSPALSALRASPASLLIRDLEKERPPFEANEQVEGKPARSAIYLPLLSGIEVTGLLTVLGARPGQLSRQAWRNLSSLTTQAAIALENSHLYSIERRRATQLALVSEVSRQVAQFLDLDELLQQVVREIRDRFGYTNVHIFAPNENNELVFRASTHPDLQKWQAASERIPSGQGIAGWVLMTGEPLLAPDVSQEPRYLSGPVGLLNTHSELAVPLKVGSRVLGVLDVQSEEVGRFGHEDLFVLGTLAAQIGIAIEDARLYAGQKEEAWYLNVLLQVSENLAGTATLDEALETVVRITPILVGVARCAIFLYDRSDNALYAARQYGLDAELEDRFRQLRFRMDDSAPGALAELWNSRQPVTVDTREPGRYDDSVARSFGLESVLLTPLIFRGELVGAMVVDQGPSPRRFSAHEIQ